MKATAQNAMVKTVAKASGKELNKERDGEGEV